MRYCHGICEECETCVHDEPIETHFDKKKKENMITRLSSNPSTALVLLNAKDGTKVNVPMAPAKKYCNDCRYFSLRRGYAGSETVDFTCSKIQVCSGVNRTIKFNVTPETVCESPEWCPKEEEGQGLMMTQEQKSVWEKRREERVREEKWKKIKGIMTWDELVPYAKYHMPPTPHFGRCDFIVERKYVGSVQCIISGTHETRWFYKDKEDWKFCTKYE